MCKFHLISFQDVEDEELNILFFSFDSEKKQQTLDDPSLTTPTCVGLRVSSERLISQHSDPLLPTAAMPKHSSTSLDTKVSLSYDENLTFSQQRISQVSDDQQELPHTGKMDPE